MDEKTLKAYSENAEAFLEQYTSADPYRLYELMKTFFIKGANTLDIGCASGRDMAWLLENGFPTTGLDAVARFVEHSKKRFPDQEIIEDSLPKLTRVKDGSFNNILLSAVLMHIPKEDLEDAISNIVRVLSSRGRVLLSIRTTIDGGKDREEDGRLFTQIDSLELQNLFTKCGCSLLFHESMDQQTRMGLKVWQNFVFEKGL